MTPQSTPQRSGAPVEPARSTGALALAPCRYRVGACAVDASRGCIERAGLVLRVEPRVMDVLTVLATGNNRTVGRDELIERVWGHPYVTDEALSRCISLLRSALGDNPRHPRYVETVPKRGYRLMLPVEVSPAGPTHVAVLPFLNLSGTAAHQHLADGITELLITYAAAIPALRVVSRTSSLLYRDSSLRLTEIARELQVARVVEGSILASASTLQAVMQLIDPLTDMHVLVRSYRCALDEALRVQNEVAYAMAAAVADAVAA